MTNANQDRRYEKQARYLSQAIQLEEAVNPRIIRSTMTMVSLSIVAFIVWAGCTNINEVARAPGEVVPRGYQRLVQHMEGGVVMAIHVQEGQNVKEGDKLLTLEISGLAEDLAKARSRQQTLDLQSERLRAFIDGRKPDFKRFPNVELSSIDDQSRFFEGMKTARAGEEAIIREQLAQKRQSIDIIKAQIETARHGHSIAREIYAKQKRLNDKGYAPDMNVLESREKMNAMNGEISRLTNQMTVAQSEVKEFEDRLASLSAQHKDDVYERLDAIDAERAQNRENIIKIESRIAQLDIRAPASGIIKGLALNTIGAVVKPGEVIMEIVPMDEALEVQVKISPKDIGHLKPGQNVQIKFSAFDFARYGSVDGVLQNISATTFSGENGDRYYKGRIRLERAYVGGDTANMAMPGMTVMTDIVTGKKTILQYLLKPIHASLKTAFTER